MSRDDGCGCMCHHWSGVKHIVQCCNKPPCDAGEDEALALQAEVEQLRVQVEALRITRDNLNADRDEADAEVARLQDPRRVMPTRGQIAIAIGDGWYAQRNPFQIADDILALEPRTAR